MGINVGITANNTLTPSFLTPQAPQGGAAQGEVSSQATQPVYTPDFLTGGASSSQTPASQALITILQAGVNQGLAAAYQVTILNQKLAALNAGQLQSISNLLAQAPTPTQQALLLKAFAAGESWSNITQYAQAIRGLSDTDLIAKSTISGGQDLIQQWQDACAPTVVETAVGQADPVFAYNLHASGDTSQIDPGGGDQAIAAQESQWLQQYGGVAVQRGQAGGQGIAMNQILNDMLGPMVHATYQTVPVADVSTSLSQLASSLQQGYDVPLRVSWNPPNSAVDSGHFMLAMAVAGAPGNYQFEIHDPWTGTTAWVSQANIQANNFSPIFGTYARLSHFYQPTPTA